MLCCAKKRRGYTKTKTTARNCLFVVPTTPTSGLANLPRRLFLPELCCVISTILCSQSLFPLDLAAIGSRTRKGHLGGGEAAAVLSSVHKKSWDCHKYSHSN